MKILFIISSLGSGGAERVLSHLANTLCEKYDITIATFSTENSFYPLNKRIKHIKLNLLRPSNSFFERSKNILNRFFVLRKTIQEVDADIHISFMTQTNILSIVASKLSRKRIIVSERTTYDFYQSNMINILRRISYPFSDYLLLQTMEDSKDYHFIKNLEIMNNPISKETFNGEKEKIILAVGSLDRNKGFDILIEAFASLVSCEWKLIIVGEGEERDNLSALINTLNIKNIELIGKRKDVFDWYAKASIFVLSSKREGFPNVLLEAMASGCAVVSFDCPYGPSEIIENKKNGLLVENQNQKQLGLAIQELMNNVQLRNNLGQNALVVKKTYGMDKIIKQWEVMIQKVMSND